eukprot:6070093-Amphidinium_carterae.1
MAASVQPTTVPRSSSQGAPTLADLRKQWKEWTLAVQAQVASWNERFPPYWISVLDKANAAYSQYCAMSPADRQMFEAAEQMKVIAGNYNAL